MEQAAVDADIGKSWAQQLWLGDMIYIPLLNQMVGFIVPNDMNAPSL